ncbi:MAG: MFS transporter [Dehalococcoidia bacterium]
MEETPANLETAVEPPKVRRPNRFIQPQWAELLEDDSFRRYWFMRLASHGATNALTYTLLVLTVNLSASAIATGILLLTLIVPSALLGAIAGVAVDRLPRGLILCVANVCRAGLVILLIGAKDSLPSLYAVALCLSTVAQFAGPAESAVVPHIVRQGRLVAANSVLQLGTLATQVVGMLIIAPILLKTTNGDPLLFILALLFIFSAGMILLIPQFRFTTEGSRGLSIKVVRREFAESWIRLQRDPTSFLALVLLVVTSVGTLIIATLLPKFATHVLGIAPENIVFVLAPVGVAIFLGLRSVEFLATRLNKLVVISGAYLIMALSLALLGMVPPAGEALEAWNPIGVFDPGPLNQQTARIAATIVFANMYGYSLTVVMTMGRVLLNERVPQEMQGRVFAAQTVLANLVAILPVAVSGLIADAVGVEPVLIVAGICALLAAAWSQARSSRVIPVEGVARGPA